MLLFILECAKAADELNTTQPSLSRNIQALESMLKTTLIIRTSRGLILTREGEIWFQYVKKALAELETAKMLVEQDSHKVQGEIKITTTFGFASTVLIPHLAEFSELYPDVRLNLICNDANLNLNMREADVAITTPDFYNPSLLKTYLST